MEPLSEQPVDFGFARVGMTAPEILALQLQPGFLQFERGPEPGDESRRGLVVTHEPNLTPGARGLQRSISLRDILASMKVVTIRELRTRPRQVRESPAQEREAILTVNGRPVAVLLPVDAGTVDETVETVRRVRALEALRAVRRESQARGTAQTSAEEIDDLIVRTRRARRRRTRG